MADVKLRIRAFTQDANKTQPVLVYCYRGNSSQRVAAYLTEQGYTDVYSLQGGFEAWRQYVKSQA